MPAPRNLKLQILELRQKGNSYREIEKMLKCSRRTINYHCEKHNLTDIGTKKYPISTEIKLSIFNYCQNNSTSKAQKHFNLSKSTIFKYRNFQLEKDEQE
jgi:transposase